jgi:predicted NBD/HSP70 family sugar kinase
MDVKPEGLFHYKSLTDKERKNLAILELIRRKGPISRTEISKITDINIVSVSNYVKDYIDKKILLETGWDVSSGGRRPELVELNKRNMYVIGLDIGGPNVAAAVMDLSVNTLTKLKLPVQQDSMGAIAEKSIEVLKEVMKKSGIDKSKVLAAGIGISGSGQKFAEVRNLIEQGIGIETFMGSDAACAAFGEKKLNPQADAQDLLYMFSDMGCGIVIRGDIYFGAGGSAGEIQISREHISKEEELIFLKSAQYLKPWGFDLGIAQMAIHEIEKGVGTKIVAHAKGDPKQITREAVIEAAKDNDDLAADIIRNAGMNLGVRVAYLVNLFNPEVVIIGGGVEKAGEIIMEPVRNTVKKLAFSEQANMVKIITGSLGEDAVTFGAAALAIREVFLKA